MIWYFFEFLLCFIDSVLLYVLAEKYAEDLSFRKTDIIVISGVAIISFLRIHFGVSRLISPLIGIFISWVVCMYCRLKPLQSTITALLYFVFIEISEILVMGALTMFFGDNYANLMLMPISNFMAIIVSRIIFLLMVCGSKINLKFNIPLKYQTILITAIIMITLCMECMCINASNLDIMPRIRLIFTFTSVIMFGIILMILLLFNRLAVYYSGFYESREIAYALQADRTFYENVAINNEQTRRTVHDYKNHIFTAIELLRQGQVDETISYLSGISGKLDKPYKNFLFNNIADIVINQKMALAQKSDVVLTVEGVMGEVNIERTDICSLIANMLDNAIEAAEKCDNGYVRLRVKMQGSYLYISTTNSTISTSKPKIIGGNFITTKVDKTKHGMGLKIIKDIVNRYNGEFYFDIKNNTASVSVLLTLTEGE